LIDAADVNRERASVVLEGTLYGNKELRAAIDEQLKKGHSFHPSQFTEEAVDVVRSI